MEEAAGLKLRQSGTSNRRSPLGFRLTPLFPTPEPWPRPARRTLGRSAPEHRASEALQQLQLPTVPRSC
jgi:hypothetical protein